MKRFGVIACILLVFLVSAFSLVVIYYKGKDQKPLRYADIPQETIDWINNLGNETNDIISSFNPRPRPTPWDNDDDIGQDPETGMKTLEDEYFIFYFPESLKDYAFACQKDAHEAIPRMEDIIGKYYYPKDMNDRKVPIYLATNQAEFEKLMVKFNRGNGKYDDVAGITLFTIYTTGLFLEAIVLNGEFCFREKASTSFNKKHTRGVLWHEMTHYCYFASVDFNKVGRAPTWVTEGIAEYTGKPDERPKFSQKDIDLMRKDCKFTDNYFPYIFENYQGGHSIYCYMEDKYKKSGLKSFVSHSYNLNIPQSINQAFSISIQEFENNWKRDLDDFIRWF